MQSQLVEAPSKAKTTLMGVATLAFVGLAFYVMPTALWAFESSAYFMLASAAALLYLSDRTKLGRWHYRFWFNWFHYEQMPPESQLPPEKVCGWVYNQPKITTKIVVASWLSVGAFALTFWHYGFGVSLIWQFILGILEVPVALLGFALGYAIHHTLLHKLPFVDNIDDWGNKLQNLHVADITDLVKNRAGSVVSSFATPAVEKPTAQAMPAAAPAPAPEPEKELSFEEQLRKFSGKGS